MAECMASPHTGAILIERRTAMRTAILVFGLLALAVGAFAQAPEPVVELYAALAAGDAAAATRLLSNPVDADAKLAFGEDYTTPLVFVLSMNRPELVDLLLAHGADADMPDSAGRRPIFLAAACAGCETVLALLDAGCRADDCDAATGLTVREISSLAGNSEVAHLLAVRE